MKVTLLLIAIRLSIVGTLTVVALWSAAALGKWKKGVAFRAMVWASIVGGAIPLLFYALWAFFNVGFGPTIVVFWPSSIALMGLDSPGNSVFKVFAVVILVLMNSGLYGLMGVCIGFVWQKLVGRKNEQATGFHRDGERF
jgi:hypothetical protein